VAKRCRIQPGSGRAGQGALKVMQYIMRRPDVFRRTSRLWRRAHDEALAAAPYANDMFRKDRREQALARERQRRGRRAHFKMVDPRWYDLVVSLRSTASAGRRVPAVLRCISSSPLEFADWSSVFLYVRQVRIIDDAPRRSDDMPDMTSLNGGQKTYDENRAFSKTKATRRRSPLRKRAPVRQVLLRRDPQPDPAHYAMMDEPMDPARRSTRRTSTVCSTCRRSRPAWRSAVQPAQRRRLHRQQDPLPGVHRRHGRLVVRMAPARGLRYAFWYPPQHAGIMLSPIDRAASSTNFHPQP